MNAQKNATIVSKFYSSDRHYRVYKFVLRYGQQNIILSLNKMICILSYCPFLCEDKALFIMYTPDFFQKEFGVLCNQNNWRQLGKCTQKHNFVSPDTCRRSKYRDHG